MVHCGRHPRPHEPCSVLKPFFSGTLVYPVVHLAGSPRCPGQGLVFLLHHSGYDGGVGYEPTGEVRTFFTLFSMAPSMLAAQDSPNCSDTAGELPQAYSMAGRCLTRKKISGLHRGAGWCVTVGLGVCLGIGWIASCGDVQFRCHSSFKRR